MPSNLNLVETEIDFWNQLPSVLRNHQCFSTETKIAWLPLEVDYSNPYKFKVKNDIACLDISFEVEANYTSLAINDETSNHILSDFKITSTKILKYKIRNRKNRGWESYIKHKVSNNFVYRLGLLRIPIFDLSYGYVSSKDEYDVTFSVSTIFPLMTIGATFLNFLDFSSEEKIFITLKIKDSNDFNDFFEQIPNNDIGGGGRVLPLNTSEELFDSKMIYNEIATRNQKQLSALEFLPLALNTPSQIKKIEKAIDSEPPLSSLKNGVTTLLEKFFGFFDTLNQTRNNSKSDDDENFREVRRLPRRGIGNKSPLS